MGGDGKDPHRQRLQQPYDTGGDGLGGAAATIEEEELVAKCDKVTTVVTQHEGGSSTSLKASQV